MENAEPSKPLDGARRLKNITEQAKAGIGRGVGYVHGYCSRLFIEHGRKPAEGQRAPLR
jgi:hypothetical protein